MWTAATALISSAASKAGEYLITTDVPAAVVLVASLLTGIGSVVGYAWWRGEMKEVRRVTRTVRDTVERQITKRDTVTETRPVRVTVYDTVRAVDTVRVPIPSGYDFRGLTTEQPVQVDGMTFTLTEYRPGASPAGRFVQSTYRARPDRWALDVEGALTGGFDGKKLRSVSTTYTAGLSYSRGPWTTRLAGGVTSAGYGVGEVAVSYEIASW